DYLLAAKVVTGNGKRLHLGSYAHKSVAGYDVLRLLVGSEGTLALFIEITLKLISLPEASATLLATFTNPTTALVTSNNLLQEGFLPRTLEFVDSTCLDALAKNLEKKPQWLKKGSSLLLIEFDGTSSEVRKNTRKCAEFLRHFADKLLYGYSAVRQKELWSLRRGMSSALFGICEDKVSEDVAVPLSALPQLYTQASRIAKKFGLKPAIYGHAGDGNLHINFLLPKRGMPTDEAVKQLLQEAVSLGGTITGEHGIGLTKSKYLGLELDKEVIALMKRLKKVFDPNNILNPTKIFQC
ncbi:MAG: glycolate oxidase subunit GlcD, partial [Planctomycetota bacterium]|nr:glycolate oxidase subunit GlcD [Planctomycetota bacterium]